jgi:hypothetical protein
MQWSDFNDISDFTPEPNTLTITGIPATDYNQLKTIGYDARLFSAGTTPQQVMTSYNWVAGVKSTHENIIATQTGSNYDLRLPFYTYLPELWVAFGTYEVYLIPFDESKILKATTAVAFNAENTNLAWTSIAHEDIPTITPDNFHYDDIFDATKHDYFIWLDMIFGSIDVCRNDGTAIGQVKVKVNDLELFDRNIAEDYFLHYWTFVDGQTYHLEVTVGGATYTAFIEVPYIPDPDIPQEFDTEFDIPINWTVVKNPHTQVFYYYWLNENEFEEYTHMLDKTARSFTIDATTLSDNLTEIFLQLMTLNYVDKGRVIFFSNHGFSAWYGDDSSERIHPFSRERIHPFRNGIRPDFPTYKGVLK